MSGQDYKVLRTPDLAGSVRLSWLPWPMAGVRNTWPSPLAPGTKPALAAFPKIDVLCGG